MRRTPRAPRTLFAPPEEPADEGDGRGHPKDTGRVPEQSRGPREDGRGPAGRRAGAVTDPAEQEREAALARLFELHYTSMLRLAALLGADDPENIVAEAYYEIYRKWRRLRDADRAESYLRSVVCNLTRMRIRHLQIVRKHTEAPPADPVASAEYTALLHDDQQALIGALQQLPPRQREALVLRHWMGLKEGEIAKAMGISTGSVKTHTARGIAALTQVMENRR
ncbi:sigma-70 family RNA polymerase sigma factor [Streptomyces sp. NPDC004838]